MSAKAAGQCLRSGSGNGAYKTRRGSRSRFLPGSGQRSLALVDGLDVLRWEVAHVSVATAPPARGVGAVEEFDDVAAQEAQLGGVVWSEVVESVGVVGALQGGGERG